MPRINREYWFDRNWVKSLSINIPSLDLVLTKVDLYQFVSVDHYNLLISLNYIKIHLSFHCIHTTHAPFQITKWYLDNYYHNKSSVILTSCNYFRFIKVPPNQLSAFHKFSKDFIPFSPRNIFSWCVSVVCY